MRMTLGHSQNTHIENRHMGKGQSGLMDYLNTNMLMWSDQKSGKFYPHRSEGLNGSAQSASSLTMRDQDGAQSELHD